MNVFLTDILGIRYRFGDENDGLEAREETLRSVAVPDATQGRRETTQTEETGSSELQSLLFIASPKSTSCVVVVVVSVCVCVYDTVPCLLFSLHCEAAIGHIH